MENYVGKIAVVTGAGSGIGAGIAKELVKRGCVTIGIGRKLDKLQVMSINNLKLFETFLNRFR